MRSVDVMRGATVAGMVIVNNPGNWGTVFAPLLHAEWNGWTPTDLIFPFFLFIVGVSLTLGTSLQGPWGPVVRRTLVIAGLGLLMAGFPYFRVATWRIPGVLMRIALCYFFAVAVVRATAPREGSRSADSLGPGPRRRRVVAAIGVLLVSYWILEVLVPVPGQGQGRLVAGEDLSAWLDRALLGRHLWKPTWDPEGLLSTMPAVATTLLGVLAGWWLREAPSPRSLVRGLAGWGLAGVVAGLFWHEWFPINKSLWTSSYVLFTGGLASAALAGCYWWCDVAPDAARVRTSEPFVVLGRNAILLFVLSGLAVKSTIFLKWPAPPQSLAGWLYQAAFVPLGPPKVASLLYALAHLAVLYALLLWLHRRRLYFTA